VDAAGQRALRETAIGARHQVVATNALGTAHESLGHELRMLDDVGLTGPLRRQALKRVVQGAAMRSAAHCRYWASVIGGAIFSYMKGMNASSTWMRALRR